MSHDHLTITFYKSCDRRSRSWSAIISPIISKLSIAFFYSKNYFENEVEDEIYRLFEFQEKERIFPKRMFEFQRKKEFFPKFLTKLARFWLKSDIFINEMIGDHFTITHRNYEPRSLTIMIAKSRKIWAIFTSWSWSDRKWSAITITSS